MVVLEHYKWNTGQVKSTLDLVGCLRWNVPCTQVVPKQGWGISHDCQVLRLNKDKKSCADVTCTNVPLFEWAREIINWSRKWMTRYVCTFVLFIQILSFHQWPFATGTGWDKTTTSTWSTPDALELWQSQKDNRLATQQYKVKLFTISAVFYCRLRKQKSFLSKPSLRGNFSIILLWGGKN